VGDGEPLDDGLEGLSWSAATSIEVLRKAIGGIVVSGGLSAYNYLPVEERQLCWTHQWQDWPGTVGVAAAAICAVAPMAERRI